MSSYDWAGLCGRAPSSPHCPECPQSWPRRMRTECVIVLKLIRVIRVIGVGSKRKWVTHVYIDCTYRGNISMKDSVSGLFQLLRLLPLFSSSAPYSSVSFKTCMYTPEQIIGRVITHLGKQSKHIRRMFKNKFLGYLLRFYWNYDESALEGCS